MAQPEHWPASWGTVRVVDLRPLADPDDFDADYGLDPDPDPDAGWAGEWEAWAFPGPDGDYGHNTPSSVCPDTGVLALGGEVVALLDVVHLVIDNLYVYDAEYYQALRVREIVAPALWATLPPAPFGVGAVVFAWDKFNRIAYARSRGHEAKFSFGGEWSDLQALVDDELGPLGPIAPDGPPRDGPPSLFALTRAVATGDAARVRALLRAGLDPTAGAEVPSDRHIQTEWTEQRNTTPLWGSLQCASPAVLEVMLELGVDPNWRPPGGRPLIHGAIALRRVAHVRALLAAGADVEVRSAGMSCREHALALGCAEIVELLDAWPSAGPSAGSGGPKTDPTG